MKRFVPVAVVLVSFILGACVTPQSQDTASQKPSQQKSGEAQVELVNSSSDPLVRAYFVDSRTKQRGENLLAAPVAPGDSVQVAVGPAAGQFVFQFDTAQGSQSITASAELAGSESYVVEISTDFAPSPGSGIVGYDYLSYDYLSYGYMGN